MKTIYSLLGPCCLAAFFFGCSKKTVEHWSVGAPICDVQRLFMAEGCCFVFWVKKPGSTEPYSLMIDFFGDCQTKYHRVLPDVPPGKNPWLNFRRTVSSEKEEKN